MTARGGLRMTYLAYPVDAVEGAGVEKVSSWATEASRRLWEAGIGVYDPGDAFRVPGGLPVGQEIAAVNKAALQECDSLLAVVVAGVASLGVPAEIERAVAAGKPVGILTDEERSWHLQGYEEKVVIGRLGDAEMVIRLMEAMPRKEREGAWPLGFSRIEREPIICPSCDAGLARPCTHPRYELPRSAHPGEDAGLDLFVSEKTTCEPGQYTPVPSGWAVELPEWGWGLVTGRSSSLQRGLLVKDAIIDSGYRGELFANVFNLGKVPVVIEPGERLAQIVVMPNLTRDLVPVERERLGRSMRGQNGFGSSGR